MMTNTIVMIMIVKSTFVVKMLMKTTTSMTRKLAKPRAKIWPPYLYFTSFLIFQCKTIFGSSYQTVLDLCCPTHFMTISQIWPLFPGLPSIFLPEIKNKRGGLFSEIEEHAQSIQAFCGATDAMKVNWIFTFSPIISVHDLFCNNYNNIQKGSAAWELFPHNPVFLSERIPCLSYTILYNLLLN